MVVTAPTVTPGGRVYVFPPDVMIDCDWSTLPGRLIRDRQTS